MPKVPPKSQATAGTGTGAPGSATLPCGAKAPPPVTAEEQQALAEIGPIKDKKASEIRKRMDELGYHSCPAMSGGTVHTKDLGNGRTMAVRVDEYGHDRPPGDPGAGPHAHKESVPSEALDADGNYSFKTKGMCKFDDSGQPGAGGKEGAKRTHITIQDD